MPVVVCLNSLAVPAISLVGYMYGESVDDIDIHPDTQQGDVTYILANVHASGDFGDPTGTPPSGWTEISVTSVARIWRKVWSSPPPGTQVDAGSASAGLFLSVSFRGVDNVTPEDATTIVATGSSGSIDPGSITTVRDNAWVLAVGFCQFDLTSLSFYPTGYENTIGIHRADDALGLVFCSKVKSLAGAENPSAFSSFTASGSWRALTLALRPA